MKRAARDGGGANIRRSGNDNYTEHNSSRSSNSQAPRHVGEIATKVLNDIHNARKARRQRQAKMIYRHGARQSHNAMRELAVGTDFDDVLDRYSRLDPDFVAAVAGT